VNAESTRTFLIPEWAEQSAVFLAWPCDEGDFTPWLPAVEKTYFHIAVEVARRERLIVACRSEDHRQSIERGLIERGADIGQIRFVVMPYNDVWVRDTAPLSVQTEAGPRMLDFRFNGWGGKYEHADDAAIARRLHESGALGIPTLKAVDFVLEGGSVETDGAGSVMTTTRCLLNPNRNPDCPKDQIEAQLEALYKICSEAQAGMLARQQEIENLEKDLRAQALIADESRSALVRAEAAYTDAAQRLVSVRREAS